MFGLYCAAPRFNQPQVAIALTDSAQDIVRIPSVVDPLQQRVSNVSRCGVSPEIVELARVLLEVEQSGRCRVVVFVELPGAAAHHAGWYPLSAHVFAERLSLDLGSGIRERWKDRSSVNGRHRIAADEVQKGWAHVHQVADRA